MKKLCDPRRGGNRLGAERADETFIGARGKYWAFQKVVRPPVPAIRDAWVRNPIDAFILQGLRQKRLEPSSAARSQPPHPARHLRPHRPAAFACRSGCVPQGQVARRVREGGGPAARRPAYGERWAAKWLDVVRYADTNGFELDLERPHAWRYRDYVIQSFNSDKPYDRFIREQIAGDEMFPGDKEALVATGYLRAGSEHLVSGNIDPEESRQEVLTEIATNVGQTFLGMTINCARCHNHKFDPDPAARFLRAAGGLRRRQRQGCRDRRRRTKRPRGRPPQKAYKERLAPVEDALKALAKPFDEQLREERKAPARPQAAAKPSTFPKDKRTAEQKRLAADAEAQIKPAWDEIVAVMPPAVLAERAKLRERLHEVEATAPDPLAAAYAFVNTGEAAPQSYILRLGDPHSRLDPVEPAVPFVLKAGYQIPTASTGRRTALANWLASPENPLTARVMVNRIWQFRMGDGMVRTPNDFGVMGDKPESHALLDWLAAEFVAAQAGASRRWTA